MKNRGLARFIMILAVLLIGIAAMASEDIYVGVDPATAQKARDMRPFFLGQITPVLNAVTTQVQKYPEGKPPKCDSEYSSILTRQSDEIYIYVGFGYLNRADHLTEDLVEFELLKEQLLSPCEMNGGLARRPGQRVSTRRTPHELCGFQEISAVFDVNGRIRLQKSISLSTGEQKRVVLDIATSSVTVDNRVNRGALKNSQEAKSMYSSNDFYRALGLSDVVMYVGHSRFGGGPDFHSRGSQEKPETIDNLVTALRNSPRVPGIVGIFSCRSAEYFFDSLDEVLNDQTRLFMNTKNTGLMLQTFLASLNGVLSMQCESDLRQIIGLFDGTVLQPR